MNDIPQCTLILASSSPRRQELIRSLMLPVKICVSQADEEISRDLAPGEIVEQLSVRKAQAVDRRLSPLEKRDSIIIGSDTIVVLDGEVMNKPVDEGDAARMLTALQGRTHQVFSGVAAIHGSTGEPVGQAGVSGATTYFGDIGEYRILSPSSSGEPEIVVGHTASKVTFRPMSDDEIWAYIKTGEPLDKAGSYGVQGLGAVFIEKIEGDFYSVMGLPLNLLYQMLLRCGVSPFLHR